MAYRIEEITKKGVFKHFDNVLLGFKLIRDEDLEENLIEITAYVYGSAYAPMTPEKEKAVATGKKRIDYVDVLENYDSKKEKFSPELIHLIFLGLNAELAPNGYQLNIAYKEIISEALMMYIPRKTQPGGGGSG